MAHARNEIRAALARALKPIEVALREDRGGVIDAADLPAIRVATPKEKATIAAEAPLVLRRDLEVKIEVIDRGEEAENSLDRIVRAVEEAISAEAALGGLVRALVLKSTEIEVSEKGEFPVGVAVLRYQATYFTDESLALDLKGMETPHVRVV